MMQSPISVDSLMSFNAVELRLISLIGLQLFPSQ